MSTQGNNVVIEGETSPLLDSDWDARGTHIIARRQIRRSTALAISILSAGLLLFLGVIVQAAFTPMTSKTEIPISDDDSQATQSYTVRVLFLYIFAGGLGLAAIVAGVRIMRIVSLEGTSVERELSWAGIDIHGLSTGGLVLSFLTAIASVIAVVSFQTFNDNSGGEFQFNITESVGWMLIGCIALLLIGLYSSTELDARALLGKLIQTHTARARAITLTQLVFAIQAFVVGLPLLFTHLPVNALLVTSIITTLGASILSFVSCGFVLKELTFVNWPAAVNFLSLDRSWGTSVASHCLALIACGLHIFFIVEAVYNCKDADPGHYRPTCDANIGSLSAMLPFIFNFVSLSSLGIASVVAAVRIGSLSREYAHGEFNISDELVHTTDYLASSGKENDNDDNGGIMNSTQLHRLSSTQLRDLFNNAVPGSGDMIESAKVDGKVLGMMLGAAPAPWKTCPQTVEILSEVAHIQLTRITTGRLLSAIHSIVEGNMD
eukprot:m.104504 g.104504  ORF g.104504 m.104504 type:complete len:492 (-) comp9111_c7_seq4:4060-5535(-)